MEGRIYKTKVDIDSSKAKMFFDERAKRSDDMKNPLTAVLLGDQNPNYATEWDNFEKEYILPQLNVSHTSSFLDIGCGIGRWGELIIPLVDYYAGFDFSEEMIKKANMRCIFKGKNYVFEVASFKDVVDCRKVLSNRKFNTVIMCGVCMYINNTELDYCFSKFNELLEEKCVIYFTETVSIKERLTLNNFPSEALKASYNVIYRTPSEYNLLYRNLIEKGFSVIQQGFLPHFNKEKSYSETDRWYTILKR